MDNIEGLIRMTTSLTQVSQQIVLPPLRYDMYHAPIAENDTTASPGDVPQFHFSPCVVPHTDPLQVTNTAPTAASPLANHLPNAVAYVPPYGVAAVGVRPQEREYPMDWDTDSIEQGARLDHYNNGTYQDSHPIPLVE